MDQLVNSKEIKEILNISQATLKGMENAGLPIVDSGNRKLYNLEEVKLWIADSRSEIDNLIIGEVYHNNEIAEVFKCSTQGGMRRAHITNTLVIFSDHTKGIYEDKPIVNELGEEILLYTGMGQEGDQDINFGQNKTLNESKTNGVSVYLFEAFVAGEHIFKGQVELAEDPYSTIQRNRKVWIFPLRHLNERYPIEEDLLHRKQSIKEKEALKLSDSELLDRAKNAGPLGERYTRTKTYDRDPYVSEYVKRRAKGYCDLCGKPAPFKDKKGQPFLECHHVKWLSREGEDNIYNAVALDPSCHRKMHILDLKTDVDYLMKKIEKYKEEIKK